MLVVLAANAEEGEWRDAKTFIGDAEQEEVAWQVVLTKCDRIDPKAVGRDVSLSEPVQKARMRVVERLGLQGVDKIWVSSTSDPNANEHNDLLIDLGHQIRNIKNK